MINSKGSAVVGDEGSQLGLPAVVVVPDGRSESKQPLQHPGDHAPMGPFTVALQVEPALHPTRVSTDPPIDGVTDIDHAEHFVHSPVDLSVESPKSFPWSRNSCRPATEPVGSISSAGIHPWASPMPPSGS
jgi:hypothetical protein